MKKNCQSLMIIAGLFLVSVVIANVLASKVVEFWIITIPAAVIVYPITYLCTDVISEIWGCEYAKRLVKIGLGLQLFVIAVIYIAILLPPASYMTEFNASFTAALAPSAWMVFASMCSYFISQSLDVHLFSYFKSNKKTAQKKWMRNNFSTMTSQFVDTAIFITIAFFGVVPNLIGMILSQYFVKVLFAAADTPFFYWLTRENNYNTVKCEELN